MLMALKHRGPDSTGYAIYGEPGRNEHVMRFKVAEQDEMHGSFDIGGGRRHVCRGRVVNRQVGVRSQGLSHAPSLGEQGA